MSAAVFLKDAGYSVVVLEAEGAIGGHCNTYYFTADPGQENWLDTGVQVFINSTNANAFGLGPFTLDTVAFVERFAGKGSALPLAGYDINRYAVQLDKANAGYYLQNSTSSPDVSFQLAYLRLINVLANYPWLNTAKVPTPVPPELLVPFSDFIALHQLEPLTASVFVAVLFNGGLGDFDRLTTLYALLNLSPAITRITSEAGAGFVIKNGCISIYKGIQDYLGDENVITNAQVTSAERPTSGSVVLRGTVDGSETFTYKCNKLIVSYPQLLDKLAPLDLDETETAVFQNVRSRYYFAGNVRVGGPLLDGKNFGLNNVNANGSTPALPAVLQIYRALTYGPTQMQASSNDAISLDNMRAIVNAQLGRLPSGLVSSVTLVDLVYHTFQPYFTTDELAKANGSYTALANLQGHRNTYYVGSLARFAASFLVWEDSLQLVTDHFPTTEASAGQMLTPSWIVSTIYDAACSLL